MPIVETCLLPVNIAVLTVSDTRDLSNDTSGATWPPITEAGHQLADRRIVKDDAGAIEAILRLLNPAHRCVITTDGTGITGRDVTPEAFERVVDKKIEGFGELFRMLSYQKIGTSRIREPWAAWPAAPTSSPCPAAPARLQGWLGRHPEIQLLTAATRAHRNLVELMPRLNEEKSGTSRWPGETCGEGSALTPGAVYMGPRLQF